MAGFCRSHLLTQPTLTRYTSGTSAGTIFTSRIQPASPPSFDVPSPLTLSHRGEEPRERVKGDGLAPQRCTAPLWFYSPFPWSQKPRCLYPLTLELKMPKPRPHKEPRQTTYFLVHPGNPNPIRSLLMQPRQARRLNVRLSADHSDTRWRTWSKRFWYPHD